MAGQDVRIPDTATAASGRRGLRASYRNDVVGQRVISLPCAALMHQYERHRAAPLRRRIEAVLLPRAQARTVTGLHAATWRRSLMIDTAGNFAANFAAQGEALAVGGEAQMRYALRIVGDVFAQ